MHNSQVTYLTQPVFILGDISIDKYWLSKLSELKGRLHLVLGNHDILPLDDYQEIVKHSGGSVNALVMLPSQKIILSPIPVHPSFFGGNKSDWMNIHGHLHTQIIEDMHYSNASFDQVQIQLKSQQLFRL